MVMVRLPDAGKMHFMHSDQQIFYGGGPRHPAWTSQLRYSQGRAPPDMVPSAPKPKILATPLVIGQLYEQRIRAKQMFAKIISTTEE